MPFVKGLSASKTICVYLESLLLGSNGTDVHCVKVFWYLLLYSM